ncbi:uncharacterized protein LOC122061739 isoform X1 [Macadamia integrifolia]|uniref:uncharacterized protein LOC122061739 isoform X1 n=1 Tax=Macadamia integrifolia TaxID=60698 RepID=UPI001C5332B9|nr:uncharacterized protein LOC122061739 isoform X1 [Macadamia integrifolia]
MAAFRWLLQIHKDVPRAARFYSEGLDFNVNVCSLRWAELQSGPLKLALVQSNRLVCGNILRMMVSGKSRRIGADIGHFGEAIEDLRNVLVRGCQQNGHSSLLSFTVMDINSSVTKLMALGAELDGPIKYEIHGKVAALRCLDGHMLGLYEPL